MKSSHEEFVDQALETEHVPGVSQDREESRLVVQHQTVHLELGALADNQGTGMFRLGTMDDPRIILPKDCHVDMTLHNWDGEHSHAWRLIEGQPPFTDLKALKDQPEAFDGSHIEETPSGQANTTTFVADRTGVFTYYCPLHAKLGQYGIVEVSPAH